MRTDKQIAASKANGAKSRGPVTPRGRAVSSANSLRHGLLARTVVLPGESLQRFHDLHRSLHEELMPATAVELLLVNKMAVAHWRQMRVWGMEKAHILSQAPADPSPDAPSRDRSTLVDRAQSCGIMSQYEAGCDRQFSRSLDRFLKFRAARAAAENVSRETNLTT